MKSRIPAPQGPILPIGTPVMPGLRPVIPKPEASIKPPVGERLRPPLRKPAPKVPDPTQPENARIAALAAEFIRQFGAPGLSVAFSRGGTLIYRRAFGHTGADRRTLLTPDHVFRIASVSKPITSACIFALMAKGLLRLEDPVFGPKGILGRRYTVDPSLLGINVLHLLQHSAGVWSNERDDPMFMSSEISQAGLILSTLARTRLVIPPGRHFAYSNFGYCLLGRVIETITGGRSYQDIVKHFILDPCLINSMRIGKGAPGGRLANEVEYLCQMGGNPYAINVERMDAHGGWVGTPTDLVRFALRVDGFSSPPDILPPHAIKTMTTPSLANRGYACGWAVNEASNWWHDGGLPGVATILVRTGTGFTWAGFTNTRTPSIGNALDQLMWKMMAAL